MSQVTQKSLTSLLATSQFYWFLSHVFTVLFFTVHTFYSFFSNTKSLYFFKFALLSILTTYSIVIKQLPKISIHNENVQYFLLALSLYISSFKLGVITGSLYSFIIYSLFHILNYFQANLLFLSPSPQALGEHIKSITSTYNQQALLMASNAEIFLLFFGANPLVHFPSLILDIFSKNLLSLIVRFALFFIVLTFIKIRYDTNQFTKLVAEQLDLKVSTLLLKFPPAFNLYHGVFKSVIVGKYVALIKLPLNKKKLS